MKKIYKIDASLDLAYNHVAAVLKKRCPLDKKQYDGLSFENSLSDKKFRTAYMFQKRASKEQLLSGGESKEVADYENTKTSLKSYVDYCFYRGDADGKETTVVANFQNNRNKIEFLMCLLPFARFCPLSSDCLLPLLFQREAVYLPNLCCTSHLYYLPLLKCWRLMQKDAESRLLTLRKNWKGLLMRHLRKLKIASV